jgi:Tfp pilus assembly protein PilX
MVKDRGAILLIVLIIVLTISLLGATLMALFFNVLTLSQIEMDRTKALYLAEAGIAKAISFLKNKAASTKDSKPQQNFNSGAQPGRVIAVTKLGEGYYEVYNDFSQSTIISVGTSNGVKRTIQMRYNAL